jgi:integrase
MDRGFLIRGSDITISEFLAGWLENRQLALRDKTIYQYSCLVKNHIDPHLGETKIRDLRLADVEEFYAQLIEKGIGPRTVCIVHNVLHAAMGKAVRHGLIAANPTQGATLPSYLHNEMRMLDPGQVNRFLAAAKESPYYALYHLAITTGMRLGELLGLKWSDLDWTTRTIRINRQKQDVPGKGSSLVEPKTRSGRRTIFLGKSSMEALRFQQAYLSTRRAKKGDLWTEMDLIFPNTVGKLGDYSNIRSDFNHVLNEAGIPRIRFHDLRHTAASLLLNHNVPVIVVSQILGHTRPSVTLDIYTHVFTIMQGEAAAVMDRIIPPVWR